MNYEEKQMLESILLLSITGVFYLLRNVHPIFGRIWFIIKWFFIILLATFAMNYAKEKFKEWWKS